MLSTITVVAAISERLYYPHIPSLDVIVIVIVVIIIIIIVIIIIIIIIIIN